MRHHCARCHLEGLQAIATLLPEQTKRETADQPSRSSTASPATWSVTSAFLTPTSAPDSRMAGYSSTPQGQESQQRCVQRRLSREQSPSLPDLSLSGQRVPRERHPVVAGSIPPLAALVVPCRRKAREQAVGTSRHGRRRGAPLEPARRFRSADASLRLRPGTSDQVLLPSPTDGRGVSLGSGG